jgi:8-oxo-dGTP pyrophosphatase MutT (NUDIX family)
MNQEDIARMNAFFETHHLDKEPAPDADLDHDPEDGDAAGVAFFSEDGRLLLMKRRPDAHEHGGEWALPAGGVEPGETPEQAAAREFYEETGHMLDGEALGGRTSFLDDDTGMRFTAFTAYGPAFEPALDVEHTAFVWASPDDLPKPIHPGVLRALKGFPESEETPGTMPGTN